MRFVLRRLLVVRRFVGLGSLLVGALFPALAALLAVVLRLLLLGALFDHGLVGFGQLESFSLAF